MGHESRFLGERGSSAEDLKERISDGLDVFEGTEGGGRNPISIQQWISIRAQRVEGKIDGGRDKQEGRRYAGRFHRGGCTGGEG